MYYHGSRDELFEWDDANAGHVRRHGIEPRDAEDALLDPQRLSAPAYTAGAEPRRAYLGASVNQRILFVVVTRRAGRLRVVTARPATERERRRYGRR